MEQRRVAVRHTVEELAAAMAKGRLRMRGFQAWRAAMEEGRKQRAMEAAMTDLSGIVSRLTGVDFKKQVGIWQASPVDVRGASPAEAVAEETCNSAAQRSPSSALWEPITPVTPLLTPGTKAACSAVLGWSASQRVGPVRGLDSSLFKAVYSPAPEMA